MVRLYKKDGEPVVVARELARCGIMLADPSVTGVGDTFRLAPGLDALVMEEVTRAEFDRAAGPSVLEIDLPAGLRFYSVMLVGREKTPKSGAPVLVKAGKQRTPGVRSTHVAHVLQAQAAVVPISAPVACVSALRPVA